MLSAGLASVSSGNPLRGTVTPWVVQVDRLGQAQAVAPATAAISRPIRRSPFTSRASSRMSGDCRSIGIVLRQEWLRAYDFTTDRGAAALNEFARTNDPFANLGKLQISVEVSSVIRASPDLVSASPGSSALTRTAASARPSDGPRF